jgi:nicotinamide-nucleotide amidase
MALARRGAATAHRVEHFGAVGRGAIRLKSLEVMMDMLELALEQA